MTDQSPQTPTLAIIGGGLSGAALAYRLALDAPPAARIVVIEPRGELGRGVAYSTPDPDHRLNVPHTKMSIRTDDMAHFTRWLASPAGPTLPAKSATLAGHIFAPRTVFGDYVADTLAPFLAQGRIRHLPTEATDITPGGTRYRIALADGGTLAADTVFLALTHPAPAIPAQLAGLQADALIPDAFAPGAFAKVAKTDRLLVVGTGLTSADILATLDRQGHAGPIHVISRHGWRSKPHGPAQPETEADFATAPATTALALLRHVRRALALDAAKGLTWHAVFDRLRAQGPAIWGALPLAERQRFLRHLRSLWDVHRFRIAPQTLEVVERLERARRATFLTGRLVSADLGPEGTRLTWRARGASGLSTLTVDRIILATGPDHARITETVPLFRGLAAKGVVTADPLRLGLATSPEGLAIQPSGTPRAGLYVASPLARGTVGELMGVPEVTGWAERVARHALIALEDRLPQAVERP